MKKVRCLRSPSGDQGTFGQWALLNADGTVARAWPSLELPWRGNHPDFSCIRADTLRGRLIDSPHFGRKVYRFENKNGRENVELHVVNFAGDTTMGWRAQEKGCVGIGLSTGTMDNGEGVTQACIKSSAKALDEFIAATGGDEIEVEFVWEPGAEPADDPNPDAHGVSSTALQAVG